MSAAVEEKPFQRFKSRFIAKYDNINRIEFLVRDWQNFDVDLDAAKSDDEKAAHEIDY